ncbi:hypothetical protein H6F67_09430 [Microcoleus sp. FACHB-1515]|uniref:hypothetical protein n=1 Tax=Cyanophyceae TaxID=3028117 RepID=UPI0016872440|nr:hypothetical protein [Microcoleus sp. FACHB-1515]MBD2090073.1 hypothetical protein [Microcoleus sp. FACHB-1515]
MSQENPEDHSIDPSESKESQESIDFLPPLDDPEILRLIAVGRRAIVNRFVYQLHQLNVAHYTDWTPLLRTPNEGEFMRMLTKRIVIDSAE